VASQEGLDCMELVTKSSSAQREQTDSAVSEHKQQGDCLMLARHTLRP
jgi:hypothetical protein